MEEKKLEFPKKEPEKHNQRALQAGLEFETLEHIAWRVEKEHYDNFNSISKGKRQQILNTIKKGGITIGEVGEKLGIDSNVVADVIYLNIQDVNVLRIETL